MGKKKVKVVYHELLNHCFSKEERKQVDDMVLNSKLNVEAFVEHVLKGINKTSIEGFRLLGFVTSKTKDDLAFVEDVKTIYEFRIDFLQPQDLDNYHCTLRFNNIDPIRNVYAIGYPITAKQAEYYKVIGLNPLHMGTETAHYQAWVIETKPTK